MAEDWLEPVDGRLGVFTPFDIGGAVSSVLSPFASALAQKVVGKSPDVKAQEKMMTQQMKLEAAQMATLQTRRQMTVLYVIGGVAVAIAAVFVVAALWSKRGSKGDTKVAKNLGV